MKGPSAIEPRNMDSDTLEAFAAEGWAEFVILRGVGIYGLFLFLGFCLTSVVISGSVDGSDLAFHFGLAVVCGFLIGAYLRFAIVHELRRRRSDPPR